MSIDLKCQLFHAVSSSIVHKVSLKQVGDSLSVLLRQLFSNQRATIQSFGCKPSEVSFMDSIHLKDIHFSFSLGTIS